MSQAASRLTVLLFTDIVGSTEFKSRLGTPLYARLLERHNELFETLAGQLAGCEILKHTGDGYFAAFPTASDAVRFALRLQAAMRAESWDPQPITTRVGIHIGEVAVVAMAGKSDVVGLAADLAARVMSLAQGGQILLTREAFNHARQFVGEHPAPLPLAPLKGRGEDATAHQIGSLALRWIAHGQYLFKGSDDPLEVFEVGADGLAPLVTPQNTEKAKRVVPHDQEQTLGWRPATGLEVPGRVGWTLQRKLGEGGFGEVWLGTHARMKTLRVFKFCFDVERLRSFKRELTLFRLLKEALGDREDIARLYEVQLGEPPFFLESEYTEGGNLAEWAERQGGASALPLEQRLQIVSKIADAVAAAHSVGILHKDIKPSNVLMHTARDGSMQPRLADFGIGILTDRSELSARSITETGFTILTENESSRTGTRLYAPPESLSGKPFTVQGDVFALGVLLYQMAVGDLNRPLAAGWERDISDEHLRADIVACVDGDPARRLPGAAELAQRVRGLDARRAARQRQIEEERNAWLRRRRLRQVTTFTVVLGALLVAGGALALAHIRSLRQEQRRTLAQKQTADEARATSDTVNGFLKDMLTAADPAQAQGRQVTVREILDQAARQLDAQFKDRPAVEADVREVMGSTYSSLGVLDEAERQIQRALELRLASFGKDDPRTIDATNNLALVIAGRGRVGEAEVLLRDALERSRRVRGESDLETVKLMNNLAVNLEKTGNFAEAEELAREALRRRRRLLGDDDPQTIRSVSNLAFMLDSLGRDVEAEPLCREAMDRARRVLGDDHPDTISAINNYGALLNSLKKHEQAEPYYREALERRRRILGEDHPKTLHSINNLAYLMEDLRRPVEAEKLYLEALERYLRKLGEDHPSTMTTRNNLASLLRSTGRAAEAEPICRDVLERRRRVLGEDHPQTIGSLNNLAYCLVALKRLDEAEPVYNDALARSRRVLGDRHPLTLQLARNLAQLYEQTSRPAEAGALRILPGASTQPATAPATGPG